MVVEEPMVMAESTGQDELEPSEIEVISVLIKAPCLDALSKLLLQSAGFWRTCVHFSKSIQWAQLLAEVGRSFCGAC